MLKTIIASTVFICLCIQLICPPAQAQATFTQILPPDNLVTLSQPTMPPVLQGVTFHPDSPLLFDFIVDHGQYHYDEDSSDKEVLRLVRYFLAGLAVEASDLWVNLSPYEPDRVMTDSLAQTELGDGLLAQDYLLKRLSASLMFPEHDIGRVFWDRVYQKAMAQLGATQIPVDTFHKIWITPDKANVYVKDNTVYIADARLKVQLEEDYLADVRFQRSVFRKALSDKRTLETENVSTSVMREVLIPIIEEEVNHGANFAPLRQIFHSLILAKWFKQSNKNSLLGQAYIDQKKIVGIDLAPRGNKTYFYNQYLDDYQHGVYNFIREERDTKSGNIIPRHYFSGGTDLSMAVSEKPNAPWFSQGASRNYQIQLTPVKDEGMESDDGRVPSFVKFLAVVSAVIFIGSAAHIVFDGNHDQIIKFEEFNLFQVRQNLNNIQSDRNVINDTLSEEVIHHLTQDHVFNPVSIQEALSQASIDNMERILEVLSTARYEYSLFLEHYFDYLKKTVELQRQIRDISEPDRMRYDRVIEGFNQLRIRMLNMKTQAQYRHNVFSQDQGMLYNEKDQQMEARQGGIDLQHIELPVVDGVSIDGSHETHQLQLKDFNSEIKGLIPVQVAPSFPTNLPLLSGFPQSSEHVPYQDRPQRLSMMICAEKKYS